MKNEPIVVVSADGHVHPSLSEDYWTYCPSGILADFKSFVAESIHAKDIMIVPNLLELFPEDIQKVFSDRSVTPGYRDAGVRMAAMDEQGIAAEVMFHGGGGFGHIPFQTSAPDLRTKGVRMFNRWLSDFVSEGSGRFIGVAQLPIWDMEAMIDEVRWASDHGLGSVSFPAPRSELADYNDPVWDPFWAVCEERGMPLNCHSGSGEYPVSKGQSAPAIFMTQLHVYGRRGLPYMIFGGVFDRFPRLRLVLTEQRGGWVPQTLQNMDAVCKTPISGASVYLKRLPSEYWATNCFLANSFMARFEVEMRAQVGVDQIMWGSDYPHVEGTWPWTRESVRNTFSGLPHDEVAAMLGGNAIRCFSLNEDALRVVASKIGPLPEDVDRELECVPEEARRIPTMGFRQLGEYF